MSETENRLTNPAVMFQNSTPAGGLVYLYSSGTLVASAPVMSETEVKASGNDLLQVTSGGSAVETTILGGGTMTVAPGGNVSGINLGDQDQVGTYSGGGICSGYSKWYGPAICNTSGNLYLSGGTFTDNVACVLNGWAGQGGAVENYMGTMKVSKCVFSGNTVEKGGGGAVLAIDAASSDTFTQDLFESNTAKYGGGVEISVGSAMFSSCTFRGNTAEDGGGLELHSGANGTVRHTVFEANSAIRGGAVEVDNYENQGEKCSLRVIGGTFRQNTASSGGAIYNLASTVINAGTFEGNIAANGGAIHTTSGGELTLTGVVFTGNTATHDPESWDDGFGGAVEAFGTTSAVINGGTFSENQAEYGGAAAAHITYGSTDIVTMQTTGGTFSGNSATYGGALYLQGSDESVITVEDGFFMNNTASYGGGALCNCYGAVTVTGGTFSGNSAGNDGGAVANWNNGTVSNALFIANNATFGGALSNSYGQTLTVSGCTFTKNVSVTEGGAVWQNKDSVSVTIENSSFDGNVSVSGGAVSNGSTMTISNGTFSGNDATTGGALFNTGSATITGGTFESNTADLGGAVYTSNGSLELTSVVFTGNTARHDPESMTDGFGGAVDGFGTTSMTFRGGTFESNQAEYGGAAAAHVTYKSSDHVSLQTGSGTYLNNTANYGGALYFQANDGDIMNVTDGVFQGNSASWGGGAVCNCYGTMVITGGTFSGNSAGNDGGAVANWNNGNVSNATFIGNSAIYGGALSNSYGQTLTVSGCTFTENEATTEGGAVWQNKDSVSVTIENSVFSGNISVKGGAISNAAAMTVSGCSFLTETDTIDNSGTLTFSGSNTLEAMIDNSGEVILALCGEAPVLSRWLVGGEGTLSLSVTAEEGTYQIAGDASSFNSVFSLRLEGEPVLSNVLSLTQSYVHEGLLYELGLAEETLCLTVSATAPVVTGVSDDLNGDGRADIVMTIMQGFDGEGSTGAWLIQEDQTAAWGDLSQRNEGWEIFGMGTTSPNKATADVYLRSTDNVIGAWTTDESGHVTGWETIGEFDADTQILGLGDFNGNGQTDLLLRNTNGAVGCYFTGGDVTGWNYFQSLGDEWKISAVGDLNGDGRADVVLRNDAGYAGSWLTQADYTMDWANLDTLSDDFAIVGTGDFNGDGTDDVLLQKGTYFGAWLVQDGSVSSWMGLGELGDVAVEQIADFDGDGKDDLRIRTAAGDLGSLLVRGEDDLEWKYYGSVGAEWSTSLAAV